MESNVIHQVLSKLAIVSKRDYCTCQFVQCGYGHAHLWNKLVCQVEARVSYELAHLHGVSRQLQAERREVGPWSSVIVFVSWLFQQ